MLRHSMALVLVAAALLAVTGNAQGSNYSTAKRAVCHYFRGPLCNQAMAVVGCETGHTYSVWAANGQYLGLFQMGRYARSKYGHGTNAWAQARAAYRYFRDAGWFPWQCLPGGGLRW